MRVFVLQHVHDLDNDREDVKFIGVYSSESLAVAAATRLKEQPGFAAAPDGFHIDGYELDADHWCSGFVDGARFVVNEHVASG